MNATSTWVEDSSAETMVDSQQRETPVALAAVLQLVGDAPTPDGQVASTRLPGDRHYLCVMDGADTTE